MKPDDVKDQLKKILPYLPQEWAELTTHRLDIYDESKAKTEFTQAFAALLASGDADPQSLSSLPTAFDYVRLGHQLSSVLEWALAQINGVTFDEAITFASRTMPLMAVLRTNTAKGQATTIYLDRSTSFKWQDQVVKDIYGYDFRVQPIDGLADIPHNQDHASVYITSQPFEAPLSQGPCALTINLHPHYGSAIILNPTALKESQRRDWVAAIQHVRRRESIAMTPPHCLRVLKELTGVPADPPEDISEKAFAHIRASVTQNSGSPIEPLVASSGLSIQYAILMGLIDFARTNHKGQDISLIVPPNCYGGTNDQARRVAAMAQDVRVVDLPVDGGQEMTESLERVLEQVASQNQVPIILVEIPTNPRVEVPDMAKLGQVLAKNRQAPPPLFIVDQTFCPNVPLLHDKSSLAGVQTLSFVSGSKFPSGGRCTGGYCTTNQQADDTMPFIRKHLELCDNGATPLQVQILGESMPLMPDRIKQAFEHTKTFVEFIKDNLPNAKISFIDDQLIDRGFTPSVFSLDLPTKGDTPEAREEFKRTLNLKLISYIIDALPEDAKHCVSYGQLRKSYWTVPATSTQGTTKETDKDYIVRVALPPELDIDGLCQRFREFCDKEKLQELQA